MALSANNIWGPSAPANHEATSKEQFDIPLSVLFKKFVFLKNFVYNL